MIINLPTSVFQWQQSKNISKNFTYKMAANTSWHRYGMKLCHSHPMYWTSGVLSTSLADATMIPLCQWEGCLVTSSPGVAESTAMTKCLYAHLLAYLKNRSKLHQIFCIFPALIWYWATVKVSFSTYWHCRKKTSGQFGTNDDVSNISETVPNIFMSALSQFWFLVLCYFSAAVTWDKLS